MALANGRVDFHTRDPVLVDRREARRQRAGSTRPPAACCSTRSCRDGAAGFQNTRHEEEGARRARASRATAAPASRETVAFLDRLKEFGFRNATRGGVSIGIEDLHIPAEKATLLKEATERVERFQRAYETGNITNGERYNKVIDTWTHANTDIADAMVKRDARVAAAGSTPCS